MHARAEFAVTDHAGDAVRSGWLRRLLIVLGLLVGAWLLGSLTDSSSAQAAPTPPVRPVLPTLSVPVVPTPVVTATRAPVAVALGRSIPSLVRHVRTVPVIVSRATRTAGDAVAQTGTILRHVLRIPRATHVVQVTVRRGAPSPATSRSVLGVVHRAGLVPTRPVARLLATLQGLAATTTRPVAIHRAPTGPRLSPPTPRRTPSAPGRPAPPVDLRGATCSAHADSGPAVDALRNAAPAARDARFAHMALMHETPPPRCAGRPSASPD